MKLVGENRIDAAQPHVWRALNDPVVLKSCIPGCESIERIGGDEFTIVMLSAVGPVKARFTGALAIRNAQPPHSYDLVFEGSGGMAGFGKGTASVSLVPEGDATLLRYDASAQVGGRLAQVGSRLIDSVAKKLALEFFARFDRHFSQNTDTSPADPPQSLAQARSAPIYAPAGATGARLPGTGGTARPITVSADGNGLVMPLRIIATSAVVSGIAIVGILLKLLAM